ncbi:hypothetical protein [Amycolatopsis sp. WAC 04182]|uniref:hypothetical protein n=1 Tax=Amycolatopsis sp. WAC 04182 TaxID=2203198 RepID=UPI000F7921F1|nr:hypothetical protein [Amycolatopsis sp. WAC 04182]
MLALLRQARIKACFSSAKFPDFLFSGMPQASPRRAMRPAVVRLRHTGDGDVSIVDRVRGGAPESVSRASDPEIRCRDSSGGIAEERSFDHRDLAGSSLFPKRSRKSIEGGFKCGNDLTESAEHLICVVPPPITRTASGSQEKGVTRDSAQLGR